MEIICLLLAAILPAFLLIYYIFRKDKLKPEPKMGFFVCFKKVHQFASGKITELYNKDKESLMV